MASKKDLKEIARLFLKLGTIAFGGPAAHIAMMQNEVVDKRKWMTHEYFLDLVGAVNLIPGPNSTEMAIHIGHERGGWKGLIIAGICFITPAVLITGFFAWLYQQYGQLPQVRQFTYGIKPAIIAVILSAVFPLAKKAGKTTPLIIIGVLTLIACMAGVNEIYAMFGAGFASLLLYVGRSRNGEVKNFLPLLLAQPGQAIANARIFLIFLKIGAILYGSGYVLFAFLDSELVAPGIITRTQLIDAIAVGQFTPGPVFSAVTFIGWQINGLAGAAVATLGIFLPSFVFIAILNPLVPYMRKSKFFSSFLDGVNVASIAIILVVCINMGKETIIDWRTVLIVAASAIVTFGFKKVNNALVVVGSAALGYVLSLV